MISVVGSLVMKMVTVWVVTDIKHVRIDCADEFANKSSLKSKVR